MALLLPDSIDQQHKHKQQAVSSPVAASAAQLDWPSPSCSFEALARRPSWQEPSSPRSGAGGGALQPAIVLQNSKSIGRPGPISFRSPFASFKESQSSPTSPAIRYSASTPVDEEELSPFCHWPGASIASHTAPCSPGPYSPATTISSPGVQTPGGLTLELPLLSPYSKSMFLPPFDAAFKKRLSAQSNASSSSYEPVSPGPFSHRVHSPRSSNGSIMSNMNANFQQGEDGLLSPGGCGSPGGPSNRDLRRRSVDVGVLGNTRGHQASGRTVQTDAPVAAFVPPEQLRVRRAQRTSRMQSNESLFAQHLTSILSHSLSLCSAHVPSTSSEDLSDCPAPTTDEPSSFESSPRSSISSIEDTAPSSCCAGAGPSVRRQRLPSLPSVSLKRRLQLVKELSGWSFDANELDQDELCECACIIFECALLTEGLDTVVSMNRLRPFLLSLRSAYHARNAYHNFAHAVDVLQACYSFLVTLGLAPPLSILTDTAHNGSWKRDPTLTEEGRMGDILRPMDVLALLFAAIGHDVGHPGLSNAYMVNAKTPAAQVYNGKSVLENFHSVTLARMLKLHGFGFLLDEGKAGETTDFRQVLLASILATDMSRHFPFVGKLTEMGTRFKANDFKSSSVQDDRLLLCSGLMKCADISNPTRPHKVAKQWSTALLEEWAVQAQIEAKFKLPISVVVLNPEERLAQAKSQVGFINLFTQPLFDAVSGVCPAFTYFADKCKEGRAVWETVVLEGEETCSRPSSSSGRLASEASSPMATPKQSHSAAFTPPDSGSPVLPLSRGFSSRLPPHRAPRTLKQIDASRANALVGRTSSHPDDISRMGSFSSSAGRSYSPSTVSSSSASTTSYSMSPSGKSSLFDRSSSISSTASSLFPNMSLDDCVQLGDEKCTGDCSSITAACTTCAQNKTYTQSEEPVTYFGSPVDAGIWPPNPFRPRPADNSAPAAAAAA